MAASPACPRFIVAQLGARMHYAVPRILHQAGLLEHFYTDICATKGWPRLLKAVPTPLRPKGMQRLLGRVPTDVPRDAITAFSDIGVRYVRGLAAASSPLERSQVRARISAEFCRKVASAGFGQASATYTFNVAGLELMQAARNSGLATFMEQTIAPSLVERTLLAQESEKFPEWKLPEQEASYTEKAEREQAEWELADVIVCGSAFVRDSIANVRGPATKCVVVPYGTDIQLFPFQHCAPKRGPLRVLTVGSIGLRKGTPYVLEAARQLEGRATFSLVGPGNVPDAVKARLPANVTLVGQVPRTEIESYFRSADVFLLPSVCEGSATSTYEALLSGLPVICTPNTGSTVRDGIDGYIVPVGDVSQVVVHLARLHSDREDLAEMAKATKDQRTLISIDSYGKRLISVLRLAMPERSGTLANKASQAAIG